MNLATFLIDILGKGTRAGCRKEVDAVLADAFELEYSLTKLKSAMATKQCNKRPMFKIVGREETND